MIIERNQKIILEIEKEGHENFELIFYVWGGTKDEFHRMVGCDYLCKFGDTNKEKIAFKVFSPLFGEIGNNLLNVDKSLKVVLFGNKNSTTECGFALIRLF